MNQQSLKTKPAAPGETFSPPGSHVLHNQDCCWWEKKKEKKLITLAHPHRNAGLLGYFHLKPLATRYLLTLSMSWARGATKVQRKTFTGVIQIIICMRFQHYNQHTTLFHSFIHFPATYFPRPARPFVKECRPDAVTTPVFALQGPSDTSLLSRGQI